MWRNPSDRGATFQQPDLRSFLRKQVVYEAPYNATSGTSLLYAFTLRHVITGFFTWASSPVWARPFFPLVKWVFLGVMALYLGLAMFSGNSAGDSLSRAAPRPAIPVCMSF